MKNIYILLILISFVSANAQDTEQAAPKSKSGTAILPAAGDIAIGADALPYLNYLGNMLSSAGGNTLLLGSPTIYLRYHLSENTAIRAIISVNSTKEITRKYVNDDAARFADPLNQAVVEDKESKTTNGYAFNIGYIMSRGYGRLRGFYGAQIGYDFSRISSVYQYGNNITIENSSPTTYDFIAKVVGPKAKRVLEVDGGYTQGVGGGLIAGVEYYFLPKICIGGEICLNYSYQWGSQEDSKTEQLIGTSIVEVQKPVSPGSSLSSIATGRAVNYAGGLYLMFHF